MKKLFAVFLVIFFIFPAFLSADQKEAKITTYYPAPYGEYEDLETTTLRVTGGSPGSGKVLAAQNVGSSENPNYDGTVQWKSLSGVDLQVSDIGFIGNNYNVCINSGVAVECTTATVSAEIRNLGSDWSLLITNLSTYATSSPGYGPSKNIYAYKKDGRFWAQIGETLYELTSDLQPLTFSDWRMAVGAKVVNEELIIVVGKLKQGHYILYK